MTTSTYAVRGMTCDHCVRAVRAELEAIDGVTAVDVELAGGLARVTSDAAIDEAAVREAVERAGYELAAV